MHGEEACSIRKSIFNFTAVMLIEDSVRSNDEDYRWPVLRKKIHPILFQIVNLTFIGISRHTPSQLIADHTQP